MFRKFINKLLLNQRILPIFILYPTFNQLFLHKLYSNHQIINNKADSIQHNQDNLEKQKRNFDQKNTQQQASVFLIYNLSMNQEQNEQIKHIMREYQTFHHTISSQKLQILCQQKKDKNINLVILTKDTEHQINLNPYLLEKFKKNQTNHKILMKKIQRNIYGSNNININNCMEEINNLTVDKNACAIVTIADNNQKNSVSIARKTLQEYKKVKKIGSRVKQYVVTDQHTQRILGFTQNYIQEGKVYILAAEGQNWINKTSDIKKFSIYGKYYRVIDQSKHGSLNRYFSFTPIFPNLHPQSLILRVGVDLNQKESLKLLPKIYSQFGSQELQEIPRSLIFRKQMTPVQIILQRNNFDQLVQTYQQNCQYSKQQKNQLLLNSHKWKYSQHFTARQIKEWVKKISQNPKSFPQHFQSSRSYDKEIKYSLNISGQQYLQKLKLSGDKIFLRYSKHCFHCIKFGKVYEEVARKMNSPSISFYRMNNDYNNVRGQFNYKSTPIFAYYKQSHLKHPFLYKLLLFNQELLINFIKITMKIQLIDSDNFRKIIDDRLQSQNLMKEFLSKIKILL